MRARFLAHDDPGIVRDAGNAAQHCLHRRRQWNRKETQRIYREEELKVRRRGTRRRAIGTRAPIPAVNRPNARWSLDFVHDQLVCGRRFRILNVVDNVTKECLGAIPDVSLSDRRIVHELDRIIARRGPPDMIVSDNGTELTSNAVLAWTQDTGVKPE